MSSLRRLLAVLVATACVTTVVTASALATYPTSIAATGDSITRGFNSCLFDCPVNSWSTGTATEVNSFYLRILERNSAIRGFLYNDAVTGSKVSALTGQFTRVIEQIATYVTVEIGANDACTPTVERMTSKEAFASSIEGALEYMAEQQPLARIFVASIPNVYQLWSIFFNNATARTAWSTYSICQSLLANPTSFAEADESRRLQVRRRVIEYNEAMRRACAFYRACTYDRETVFSHNFESLEVSTIDYFHPSIRGQATLASLTYRLTLF